MGYHRKETQTSVANFSLSLIIDVLQLLLMPLLSATQPEMRISING